MILKIFFYGALVTIPVFFIQLGLSELLRQMQSFGIIGNSTLTVEIIKWFLVIAFTEELFKYLVVRETVFKSGELDEPLDIMLYMVVGALGFAALENILYLFSPIDGLSFDMVLKTTITISFIRFIGATFLHTLASALVGYFMALSSLRGKHRFRLTMLGMFLATFMHGLYNFSIMNFNYPFNIAIPILVILGLTTFMVYDFDGIKKIKSIVNLNA